MMKEALFLATGMPDPDWWHTLWPDPDGVLVILGLKPCMDVVDLCCGDGYFTAPLARLVAPGHVTGFDLDAAMLQQAQALCQDLTNCLWVEGDAMAVSELVPGPVDYVLMANTFHGVSDQIGLSREVMRVLRRGGHFAIVNWYPLTREETPVLGQPRGPRTDLRMSLAQTRAVVEPAGFVFEAEAPLPPYHYGAIFRKA